jgi:hypothetical protein
MLARETPPMRVPGAASSYVHTYVAEGRQLHVRRTGVFKKCILDTVETKSEHSLLLR